VISGSGRSTTFDYSSPIIGSEQSRRNRTVRYGSEGGLDRQAISQISGCQTILAVRLQNCGSESATHHADKRLPRYEDPPSEAERWDLPSSCELVSMRTRHSE
jgi:hypothetical protein